MFPIIIALNAIDPPSLRDRKFITPIVNTPNPTHCVTECVCKSATEVKLLESIVSGTTIITNPNSNGITAAISKKELRFIS